MGWGLGCSPYFGKLIFHQDMFSGPYNEAMQVAMGETSLGNSKLNIMSTVCGFPDYIIYRVCKKNHPPVPNHFLPLLASRFCSTWAHWDPYITAFKMSPGWRQSDYPIRRNLKKRKKYRFSKITVSKIELLPHTLTKKQFLRKRIFSNPPRCIA